MPPVRRHRIGDQLPAVVHPGPDQDAIALCRDLAANTDAEAVVLFGSRAAGGWDEQCDFDVIIVSIPLPTRRMTTGSPWGGFWLSSGSDTTRATAITTAPITGWRTG